MKYSIFSISVLSLFVMLGSLSAAVPATNNLDNRTNLKGDHLNSFIFSFGKTNAALEIEDVYDIQVMAYQIQNNQNMSIEISVSNNADAYPRLLSVLRSLQYNGINHHDIVIKVIDGDNNLSIDQIKINLLRMPELDYAMASLD